jgi:hypothetical protein
MSDNHRCEEDKVIRRRKGPGIGRILVFFFFSFLLLGGGTYTLWNQHFGVPARIAIFDCSTTNSWNHAAAYCMGHPSGRAPDQSSIDVDVYGAQWSDVNHDIDIHMLNGSWAVKDGSWWPLYFVGVGLVFAVVTVTAILGRLRAAPT